LQERKLEAYSISYGQSLLYNNIFPKHRERLGKQLSELVQSIGKADLSGDASMHQQPICLSVNHAGHKRCSLSCALMPSIFAGPRSHFDIVVACEDETGEDIDVPLVSIKFK
jgi:ubiquitin-activating enzyme E1